MGWKGFVSGILCIIVSALAFKLLTDRGNSTTDKLFYGTIFVVTFIVAILTFLEVAG